MGLLIQKALYPILRMTTATKSPTLNKITNRLSKAFFCTLLGRDPRIVGTLRAAVWIAAQQNSTLVTAFRDDDAREPLDKIVRGDGAEIPINKYPVLQQLSYSYLDAIQSFRNKKSFFGGQIFENIYQQLQNLSNTPEKMYAFVLANASKEGFLFMHEDVASPNLRHRIALKSREMELPVSAVIKIFSTGVCGTDIRGIHGKRQEIGPMTTLGHEILGVVAEKKGIDNPKINIGSLVSIIPHFWCGVCLPCMTGHTNFCDYRKHIGFEHTSGGGFAQYIAVPEQNIVPHPDNITFNGSRSDFAILEPIICCIHSMELMKENPGDPEENPYKDKKVLIFGAGPIGCIHGRIAKDREAKEVLLVDLETITPEKRKKIEGINKKAGGLIFDSFATYNCEDYEEERFDEIVTKAWDDLKTTIDTNNIEVVILAASSRIAYELEIKVVSNGGKVMFFSGLPKEERKPLIIGEKEFDIHHIHHHDEIIDVDENGHPFRIVGSQGFYPNYNGKLWNDFSPENVELVARLNPSLFVSNKIRLEENNGENKHKLVRNLTVDFVDHLKNLVIIGHKPNGYK
ncbi:MAG: alcohol dehydrogenase catalytic domain-containing protein [Candidatus Saganbacteria bacterium]|nr:alcohol dehydrogenase catalytic domain-containing protein [Candidatus Saganbacteria bacterium]